MATSRVQADPHEGVGVNASCMLERVLPLIEKNGEPCFNQCKPSAIIYGSLMLLNRAFYSVRRVLDALVELRVLLMCARVCIRAYCIRGPSPKNLARAERAGWL